MLEQVALPGSLEIGFSASTGSGFSFSGLSGLCRVDLSSIFSGLSDLRGSSGRPFSRPSMGCRNLVRWFFEMKSTKKSIKIEFYMIYIWSQMNRSVCWLCWKSTCVLFNHPLNLLWFDLILKDARCHINVAGWRGIYNFGGQLRHHTFLSDPCRCLTQIWSQYIIMIHD